MHPHKLLLFKKEGCAPCSNALDHLERALDLNPEYGEHIKVLQKEDHQILVEEYKLEKYPTLICIDEDGMEIGRKVGQKYLDHFFFTRALNHIHRKRNS